MQSLEDDVACCGTYNCLSLQASSIKANVAIPLVTCLERTSTRDECFLSGKAFSAVQCQYLQVFFWAEHQVLEEMELRNPPQHVSISHFPHGNDGKLSGK